MFSFQIQGIGGYPSPPVDYDHSIQERIRVRWDKSNQNPSPSPTFTITNTDQVKPQNIHIINHTHLKTEIKYQQKSIK